MTCTIRLFLGVFVGLCVLAAAGCGRDDEFSGDNVKSGERGLKYIVLKEGSGEPAKAADKVEVHYTGWLRNGTKFDSSRDAGKPFVFQIGVGEVIKGWDYGVAGMKVGERRKLLLPPDLAYGESGSGKSIPPNSTLVFDVELLKVLP
jgi:peptidylprolyl isomerase